MDDSDIIEFLLSDDQDSGFKHLLCGFSEDLQSSHQRVTESFHLSNNPGGIRGVDYALIGADRKKPRGNRISRKDKCRRSSWDEIVDMIDGIITEDHLEQEMSEIELFNGDKKTNSKKKKIKSQRSKNVESFPGKSSNPEKAKHKDNGKVNMPKKSKKKQNPLPVSESEESTILNFETEGYSKPGGATSKGRRSNEVKSKKKSRSKPLKDSKFLEIRDEGTSSNFPNHKKLQLEKANPKKRMSNKPKVSNSGRQEATKKVNEDFKLVDGINSNINASGKETTAASGSCTEELSERQKPNKKPTHSEKRRSKKSKSKQENRNTDTIENENENENDK